MRTVALHGSMASGFVALALCGGSLSVGALCTWAVAVAVGWVPMRFRRKVPWGWGTVGWLVAVGALAATAQLAPVAALGWVLAWLQVHRRGVRSDATDDRVTVLLAGLMVVAAAGEGVSAAFAVPSLCFAALLPLALLPDGPAGRSLRWWPLHLLLAVGLFLALPRRGAGPDSTPEARLTGFAPDVELGALQPLLDDPGVVLRARAEGELPERVYWRGLALDGFDGQRWYSSTPPRAATVAGRRGVRVEVTLAQQTDGVLFVPGQLTGWEGGALRTDAQGGWFVPAGEATGDYVVYVDARGRDEAWMPESALDASPWLDLPGDLDPRVRELARSVAGEGPPRARVEALTDWLRSEVVYTRDGREASESPLEDFLLEQRRGHCEFVAAGLAVMARAVDVPSRVVNGFASSERDPVTGERVVRRQHAHAWTEVLLDGRWVLVDATPVAGLAAPPPPATRWRDAATSAWDRAVVSYDRDAQRDAVVQTARAIEAGLRMPAVAQVPWRGMLVLAGLSALIVGLVRWGLARWARRVQLGRTSSAGGPVARQHRRARQLLADKGYAPPEALPPVDAARWLKGRAPEPVAEAMEALAWLYYETALGGRESQGAAARARGLVERVVQGLDDHGTRGA
jgi:transglutaminase-like putative cysteine protease